MLRIALAAVLASGCAASTVAGATTMTAAALGSSALQRSAGGCYAICTSGTTCNPRTGFCERMPCDGRCGPDQHCEATALESKCVAGPPSDVTAQAPGTQKTLPVLPAPPSVSGGPPQIVPAAEQKPPSGK